MDSLGGIGSTPLTPMGPPASVPTPPATQQLQPSQQMGAFSGFVVDNCQQMSLGSVNRALSQLTDYTAPARTLEASVTNFVAADANIFPVPTANLQLQALSLGGTKGRTGSPVLLVKDGNASVGVVKCFKAEDEFLQEVIAINKMSGLKLKEGASYDRKSRLDNCASL